MFNMFYRRRLGVGITLQILRPFTGLNAISFYSSFIFGQVTDNKTLITTLTVGLGFIGLLAGIVAGFLTKYYGRKALMIAGTILGGIVSMIVLAIVNNSNILDP
jgi:MFS family permease